MAIENFDILVELRGKIVDKRTKIVLGPKTLNTSYRHGVTEGFVICIEMIDEILREQYDKTFDFTD